MRDATEGKAAADPGVHIASPLDLAKELCDGAVDPLVVAILQHDTKKVNTVIRAMGNFEAQVNRRMKNGENALQLTLRARYSAILPSLRRAKANVENCDNSGATALITQARVNGDLFALLCLWQAAVNAMDHRGYTALHYAVELNNKDSVLNLVTQGADVHLRSKKQGSLSAYSMAQTKDTRAALYLVLFVTQSSHQYTPRRGRHPLLPL